jgi:hypothetical protein
VPRHSWSDDDSDEWRDVSTPPSEIDISQGLLDFDTHNLFLVGSPVAFFLLLENTHLYPRKLWDEERKGEKPPYGCIAAENVYNVLHYSDPVSNILGPAADRFIASKTELADLPTEKQFIVPDPAAGSFIDTITSKLPFLNGRQSSVSPHSSRSRSTASHNVDKSPAPPPPSTPPRQSEKPMLSDSVKASPAVELETRSFVEEARGDKIMRLLNDNGQLDWVIPLTGIVENQYVSMITAHSIYWDNRDFARLVAVECCRRPGAQYALEQYKARRHLDE